MLCRICKKEIPPDSGYYYGTSEGCCSSKCFGSFLESQKKQEQRDQLYELIQRIFYTTEIPTKIFIQAERIKKDYNLSDNQLRAVLHYMYDIKKISVYGPTLYYVKDYIDEAREYYNEIKEKNQRANALIEKQKEQVIQKVVKPNYKQKKRKNKLAVDLDEV